MLRSFLASVGDTLPHTVVGVCGEFQRTGRFLQRELRKIWKFLTCFLVRFGSRGLMSYPGTTEYYFEITYNPL